MNSHRTKSREATQSKGATGEWPNHEPRNVARDGLQSSHEAPKDTTGHWDQKVAGSRSMRFKFPIKGPGRAIDIF